MKKNNSQEYEKPLVSIIIPTFKRPKSLTRTIDSVLNSSYKNIEVIIVDDNNPGDNHRKETEKIMSLYLEKHYNIIYIKHEHNKNGSAARNTGINASTGKYLMFLDDDDEFLMHKIEKQVNSLEARDNTWGACYTKYVDMRDGNVVSRSAESSEGDLLVRELARNFFVHAGSNLMVRRNVVLEINGFDESFVRNQDVEFLVRILKKYKIAFVDDLGLIVHTRPRKYKMSFEELTNHYLEKFRDDINDLEHSDSNAVYKMIGLQLIRNSIQTFNLKKVVKYKQKFGIGWGVVIDYLLHLVKRKITKKSCGYNMKKLYKGVYSK